MLYVTTVCKYVVRSYCMYKIPSAGYMYSHSLRCRDGAVAAALPPPPPLLTDESSSFIYIYIYIYIYICTACVHSVRAASCLGVFVQIQEIPVSIRLFFVKGIERKPPSSGMRGSAARGAAGGAAGSRP